jgi:hypothetical protein
MANLQHLIAALGKVADAYAPYAPEPNDDDSDLNDDDSGSDDGDPNDGPRSYDPADDEADKENAEDEDQESDFRRRKALGTVMLLHKLDREAEGRFITELKTENLVSFNATRSYHRPSKNWTASDWPS